MFNKKRGFLSIVVIFLMMSMSYSQTVINGSFETWPSNCPYNVAPTGWTNFSTSLGPDKAGTCAGSVVSYFGNAHMNLVWISSGLREGASQTINGLTAGITYQFQFYATHDQGLYANNSPCIVDAYVAGAVVFSTPQLNSGDPWNQYTINFTATDTNELIGFRIRPGNSGTSGSAGIDGVTVTNPLSIGTAANSNNLCVYPSVVDKELQLLFNNRGAGAVIFTIKTSTGQVVYRQNYDDAFIVKTIDMDNFSSGLYILTMQLEKEILIKKIIKK